MTSLHTVSKGVNHPDLQQCLDLLSAGDEVLLIEDGVYWCLNEAVFATLKQKPKVYVLGDDLSARGLGDKLPNWMVLSTMVDFVKLSCTHSKTISWF